jgi:hypothetical protein
MIRGMQDAAGPPAPEPWQVRSVSGRLPAGARPTAACWHPVPGLALRNAPDDVEALTQEEVRRRLPTGPSLVVSLRETDIDPVTESAVLAMVRATGGGALVVGVAYDDGTTRSYAGESCPECGATGPEVLGPAEADRPGVVLLQCRDCGTAWDA